MQRRYQHSFVYTFCLWGSLCVMTAIVAGITAAILGAFKGGMCSHSVDVVHLIKELSEGMAGGAMLTMLACVAMPESYHMSGDHVGFVTVLGFLATMLVGLSTHVTGDGDIHFC